MNILGLMCLLLATALTVGHAKDDMTLLFKTLQEKLDKIGIDDNNPIDLPPQNSTFDFIIVGSGAAGCVLANKLSENPNWSVYLLEAGGYPSNLHEKPVMTGFTQLTKSNWNLKTTKQEYACKGMNNGECTFLGGKVLGGTSQLNFMIYSRGNRFDFDRLSEEGNNGWSYDEVMPYFLRSEMSSLKGLENTPYHNKFGPLSVGDVKIRTNISHLFVEGSQQAGYTYNDYNGKSQIGVSYLQANTLNGRRHSAYDAYLKNIKDKRPNLHILTFATVTKILIDPETKTAYGVDFVHRGLKYTIKASKEVILSAGTMHSPQLLMLSGIGPKENLESVGIPQVLDLPVGEHLHDRMTVLGTVFLVNSTGETLFIDRVTPDDFAKFEAGDPSTRVSSSFALESMLFMKKNNSDRPVDIPDIELLFFSTTLAGDYGFGLHKRPNIRSDVYNDLLKPLEKTEQFGFLITLLYPKSKGFVRLADSNPLSSPIIDPGYLKDREDVDNLLAGFRETIRISKTPALQKINATLYQVPLTDCEGYEFDSDDFWRCWIRLLPYPLDSQVGTCKMGPASDPTSVVNFELNVHGIKGLRVVDTSVLPHATSGHINAVGCMIGEKASDMIKNEWIRYQSKTEL